MPVSMRTDLIDPRIATGIMAHTGTRHIHLCVTLMRGCITGTAGISDMMHRLQESPRSRPQAAPTPLELPTPPHWLMPAL